VVPGGGREGGRDRERRESEHVLPQCAETKGGTVDQLSIIAYKNLHSVSST